MELEPEDWDDWIREKLQYKLDGLVTSCSVVGTEFANVTIKNEADGTTKEARLKRYFFRAELTGHCLALSFMVRVPLQCSWSVDNIILERSVDGVSYETLLDSGNEVVVAAEDEEVVNGNAKVKKRLVELGRAAKYLRFGLIDLAGPTQVPARILGLNVVGFPRGANPNPNRLKVLLNTSFSLAYEPGAHIDRAEADSLCGLALLNARKHRQAAEVFLRAATEVEKATCEYPLLREQLLNWGEHILLLSCHAFLESEQQIPEIMTTLVRAASFSKSGHRKDTSNGLAESVDTKTVMVSLRTPLVEIFTNAITDSDSTAVKLAAARVLEFMMENLNCEIGPSLDLILGCILHNHRILKVTESSGSCTTESLATVFANILDLVCRLLPFLDNALLLNLFESVLSPMLSIEEVDSIMLDGEDAEFSSTAMAYLLRLIYVAVDILQGDVEIPTDLVVILCSVSRPPSADNKVPEQLRLTALVCWEAVSGSLALSAKHVEASMFSKYLLMMKDLLEGLFQVTENEFKHVESVGMDDSLSDVRPASFEVTPGEGEELRLHVTDTKALNRVLKLVIDCVSALEPCSSVSDSYAVIDLHNTILSTIADLARSIMLDIAHSEARMSLAKMHSPNMAVEESKYRVTIDPLLATLEELWSSLWLVIRLIPRNVRNQVEELRPMREIFDFLVDRLKERSPPRGLLQLLLVLTKGANHELNTRMNTRDGLSMLGLLRVMIPWLAGAVHAEIFELVELLTTLSARYLMPKDLLDLLKALAAQSTAEMQNRADTLLEHVASVLVTTAPLDTDAALRALDLQEKEYERNGFNCLSLPRSRNQKPNIDSFYLHVLLVTCFHKFGALNEKQTNVMGLRMLASSLEEMIDYASLAVACLGAAAKIGRKEHKEYIAALLGDIFGTCLMMHGHMDSRVRLAGLEVFCASMDVLFLKIYDDEQINPMNAESNRQTNFGHITCRRMKKGDHEIEEMGWSFLCNIVTQTLSNANYGDYAIQRACLDFVKECFLGVLLGKRSGASVIGMKDLEQMWDALGQLNAETTSKVLSLLSLWIQCVIVNLAFYIAFCGYGKASGNMRWNGLSLFMNNRVFKQALAVMQSPVCEERFWGVQLAESYLRLRHMNEVSSKAPPLPVELWNCIDSLKEDWNDEVAVTAGSLRIFTLTASETKTSLDQREEVELWIPNLPADSFNFESSVENMPTKSLDVFLSQHEVVVEIQRIEKLEEEEAAKKNVDDLDLAVESPYPVLPADELGNEVIPLPTELQEVEFDKPTAQEPGKPAEGCMLDRMSEETEAAEESPNNPSASDQDNGTTPSLTRDASGTDEEEDSSGRMESTDDLDTLEESLLTENSDTNTLADNSDSQEPPYLQSLSATGSRPKVKPLDMDGLSDLHRTKSDDSDVRRVRSGKGLPLSIAKLAEASEVPEANPSSRLQFSEREPDDPGTPRNSKKKPKILNMGRVGETLKS